MTNIFSNDIIKCMNISVIKSNKIIIKILCILLVCGLYFILSCFNVPCIFRELFNIPCPGCGMTRALRSLINLNFYKALQYHPMIYCMPVVILYIVMDGKIFKNKLFNNIILFVILIGFAVCYIVRLLNGFIVS